MESEVVNSEVNKTFDSDVQTENFDKGYIISSALIIMMLGVPSALICKIGMYGLAALDYNIAVHMMTVAVSDLRVWNAGVKLEPNFSVKYSPANLTSAL